MTDHTLRADEMSIGDTIAWPIISRGRATRYIPAAVSCIRTTYSDGIPTNWRQLSTHSFLVPAHCRTIAVSAAHRFRVPTALCVSCAMDHTPDGPTDKPIVVVADDCAACNAEVRA